MQRKLITTNGTIPFIGGASIRSTVTTTLEKPSRETEIKDLLRKMAKLGSFIKLL